MSRLPWLGDWAEPAAIAGVLRPLFLDEVSRLVPEALEALRDEVMPIYESPGASKDALLLCDPACSSDPPCHTDAPKDLWVIERESYLRAGQDLFTDDEAAVLFEQGYELLGDPKVEGPERFYLWRPKQPDTAAVAPDTLPLDHCQDHDGLNAYLASLGTALSEWASDFNLNEDWILTIAHGQLDAWHRHWYLAHPHMKWRRKPEADPKAGTETSLHHVVPQ